MSSEREERRHSFEDPSEDLKKNVQGVAVRVIRESVPIDQLTMRNPESPDRSMLIWAVRQRVMELFDIDEEGWPDDGQNGWSVWREMDEED